MVKATRPRPRSSSSKSTDESTRTTRIGRNLLREQKLERHGSLLVIRGPGKGTIHRLGAEVVIGRSSKCTFSVPDEMVSRRHATISRENGRYRIKDLGSANGLRINGERVEEAVLADGDKIRLSEATILKFMYTDELDEAFQKQLNDAANRDGLTGIFNRACFDERMDSEYAFARRHRSNLAIILFDVDRFKRVNDDHGHLVGDHVLTKVAATVNELLRQEDFFARYGGEEFAILCRGNTAPEAAILAERCRAAIERASFGEDGVTLKVTASFGVASFPEFAYPTPQGLTERADEALRAAKAGGRNRTLLAKPRHEL